MKLLILLTFCFGFVVCIPRDQVIITIPGESGPAQMPNRSGPVVFEEPTAMPEEAPANKRTRSFRTFIGSQETEYPQYPQYTDYPQYPEYPYYPEYPGYLGDPIPPPQYPEEYRGNFGINWNLKAL